MSASKNPLILDVLESRLNTVAPTLRDLEGRALSLSEAQRTPLIVMRLAQDQVSSSVGKTSIVTLSVNIDLVLKLNSSVRPDVDLPALLFAVRCALIEANETPPLDGLLKFPGIVWGAAQYGSPDGGDQYVIARQPITMDFVENYRS